MDLDLIERLIGLVEFSRVTELDFTAGDLHVRIERRAAAPPTPSLQPTVPAPAREPPPDLLHCLAAGMAGTFFRAPGPGQVPFVSEGDTVEAGQTLAILEAMKMLNPVEADLAGRIMQVLIEDGASVSAGTPLFVIVPTTAA